MKKLPVYAFYPIVLGGVCLVCGATLALVNFATENKIAENNVIKAKRAVTAVLEQNELAAKNESSMITIDWKEGEEHSNLNSRMKIECTDGSTYYYYNATTPKGYSGTVTFGALTSPNGQSIIGFSYITGDEDSTGLSAAKKIYASSFPYSPGGVITSGQTAQKTIPVITSTLDKIIANAITLASGN